MKYNSSILVFLIGLLAIGFTAPIRSSTPILQFVFTSDAHYGITRAQFRGASNVDAYLVNEAMLEKINSISSASLPLDSGLDQGQLVGPVDFLVEGGDIANRMELPVQTATVSWSQFDKDYLHGLNLISHSGNRASIYIVPGNHDISNAVGFYKPMIPATDPSSLINIYNLMMKPSILKTKETYHYPEDKINYSINRGGIHFVFISLWPDSAERIWMEKDLLTVPASMPVILFTHDQPVCEAKHFNNPSDQRGINAQDKFEDLLTEKYKDGSTASSDGGVTDMEQRGFVRFLKAHPNIKAYFHGNSNYQESYIYDGPDHDIALPVFRVDSPMKGKYSSKDETRLSFQLVTIDTATGKMTVRECLWNSDPLHPELPVRWGSVSTVSLK